MPASPTSRATLAPAEITALSDLVKASLGQHAPALFDAERQTRRTPFLCVSALELAAQDLAKAYLVAECQPDRSPYIRIPHTALHVPLNVALAENALYHDIQGILIDAIDMEERPLNINAVTASAAIGNDIIAHLRARAPSVARADPGLLQNTTTHITPNPSPTRRIG